jgi:anthranilate synthase/aminodeoxychorismate synthase-like glutamine amidotransferase
MSARVLLVDHHDSFTWNLAHGLGEEVGELPEVVQSDALDVARVVAAPPDLVVLGPGPGHPSVAADAGRSLELIAALTAPTGRSTPILPPPVPVFGVCFGLQLLVVACGGRVVPALEPMHGKECPVEHDGRGLFARLDSPTTVMRYHSLVAERASLPRELEVVAQSREGEVMAVAHRTRPWWAVQFHPESVGTPLGATLLRNVVELALGRREERRR